MIFDVVSRSYYSNFAKFFLIARIMNSGKVRFSIIIVQVIFLLIPLFLLAPAKSFLGIIILFSLVLLNVSIIISALFSFYSKCIFEDERIKLQLGSYIFYSVPLNDLLSVEELKFGNGFKVVFKKKYGIGFFTIYNNDVLNVLREKYIV